MSLIQSYLSLPAPIVVGVMSGTSADGVDAVKVRIEGERLEFLGMHTEEIPQDLRCLLFRLFEDQATVREVSRANVAVGELFARAVLNLMEGQRPDLIGSHGQTVAHLPDESPPSTLQIGEPAIIAARTQCLTVGDFRCADMAWGGQAAPLVPFFDQWLLRDGAADRLVLNLGGMANITWIPCLGRGQVVGWDTGPANVLMDAFAEIALRHPFDTGGQLAAQGRVLPDLLEELLANPYFARRGPKSTGREEFGRPLAERLWGRGSAADLMRTAAAFTAESVALAVEQLEISPQGFEVVLGGGGAKNPILLEELQVRLHRRGARNVRDFGDFGVPAQAREAAAFALFAHLTLNGQPSALPAVTGARRPAVQGKICQP